MNSPFSMYLKATNSTSLVRNAGVVVVHLGVRLRDHLHPGDLTLLLHPEPEISIILKVNRKFCLKP